MAYFSMAQITGLGQRSRRGDVPGEMRHAVALDRGKSLHIAARV